MIPDATILAIASAWKATMEFNMAIWNSLNKEQQTKIVDWYIEDIEKFRNFWQTIFEVKNNENSVK